MLGSGGLPLPMPLPQLLLPARHSTLRDVISREKFRRPAPLLDPPVFPDLRIEEQGRIAELALGRTALVTVAVVLAPLAVRGRERRRRSSSRLLSSRGLRIDTGTALGGLLTATDHVVSVRIPLLAGRHAIFVVVLVTARGRVDDHLPLTVRGQRRDDGEPDVSSRRVWRR